MAVPGGVLVQPGQDLGEALAGLPRSFRFPAIFKPAWEGSSKGIRGNCLADDLRDLAEGVEALLAQYRQPVLVEEYVAGDELTVGVVGNDPPRVLGVMRVVPVNPTERFVYSLEIKRDFRRLVRYECPPPYPARLLKTVERAALASYQALGCRDVARVDFRLRDGVPYFLELNPLPGLHPEDSDLVIMARSLGWTYRDLVGTILRSALDRQPGMAACRWSS